MLVNLFDIAVINVGKSIDNSTMKSAKNGWPNYTMRFCFGAAESSYLGDCPICFLPRCRLMIKNLRCGHAAAKLFVMAVLLPI